MCKAFGVLTAMVILASINSAFVNSTSAFSTARTMEYGDWSTPVKISNEEMFHTVVSSYGIYQYGQANMTYSSDWGGTWAPEKTMEGRIEIVGDILYRVNTTYPLTGTLCFGISTDNGTTWSTPRNLGLTAHNYGYYDIQMLNGALFVYDYDGHRILLIKSADLGNTWSSPVTVATVMWVDDTAPNDLVFLNGKLFLSYWNCLITGPSEYRFDVMVIESNDMGDTWANSRVIGSGSAPMIKEDDGTLYVTYIKVDTTNMSLNVGFTKSNDEGQSWTTPLNVGVLTSLGHPSYVHSLAASAGRIAAAYLDYQPGMPDRYVMKINLSEDGGVTWRDLGDVTSQPGNAELPSVWILAETLHYFWVDMGAGNWSDGPFPTYYRTMDLASGPVITEFPGVLLPLSCVLLMLIVCVASRYRS